MPRRDLPLAEQALCPNPSQQHQLQPMMGLMIVPGDSSYAAKLIGWVEMGAP